VSRSNWQAALDDWAIVCRKTRKKGDITWKELLARARAADPDDWRNKVRDALEQQDLKALKELASSQRAATLPPSTQVLLGNVLSLTFALLGRGDEGCRV